MSNQHPFLEYFHPVMKKVYCSSGVSPCVIWPVNYMFTHTLQSRQEDSNQNIAHGFQTLGPRLTGWLAMVSRLWSKEWQQICHLFPLSGAHDGRMAAIMFPTSNRMAAHSSWVENGRMDANFSHLEQNSYPSLALE